MQVFLADMRHLMRVAPANDDEHIVSIDVDPKPSWPGNMKSGFEGLWRHLYEQDQKVGKGLSSLKERWLADQQALTIVGALFATMCVALLVVPPPSDSSWTDPQRICFVIGAWSGLLSNLMAVVTGTFSYLSANVVPLIAFAHYMSQDIDPTRYVLSPPIWIFLGLLALTLSCTTLIYIYHGWVLCLVCSFLGLTFMILSLWVAREYYRRATMFRFIEARGPRQGSEHPWTVPLLKLDCKECKHV